MKEKNINDKIREKFAMKQAKELTKTELEEYYVYGEADDKGNALWYIILIMALLISILGLISLIFEYPHSEYENYRDFSETICEEFENSDLRGFDIREEQIEIQCYSNNYYIDTN